MNKSSHDDISTVGTKHTIRKKPGIEITLKIGYGLLKMSKGMIFLDPLGKACDVLKTPHSYIIIIINMG